MPSVKSIHHVAVVVANLDASLAFWQGALGMIPSGLREVPAEQARVAFLPLAESELELVQPTTSDSGLARFLENRGQGLHHVCLEVDDLPGMLLQLKSLGIRLINDEPRTGSDSRLYAFVHPESTGGVLVELYQFIARL
jgi:methylmalonyl-CoA/ethylmalonyl-CoA epimerase